VFPMDEAASEFLRQFRPLWGRLRAVAGEYCARREDVGDLVQETLLRAWRAFSPVEGPTHPRAWLFAIMRNVAIDWHRAASRQVSIAPTDYEELTELAGTEPGEPFAPLSAMNEEQFREFLDASVTRALDALEAPFREVVILSIAADMNYREIAEVLDCPVGTVMSRMARARRALRERLADFSPSNVRRKEVRQ